MCGPRLAWLQLVPTIAALVIFVVGAPSWGRTIYVNASSQAKRPDGGSWDGAFSTVQEALSQARAGDEVWVAQGVYRPTNGNDRGASFRLVEGVAVYGGFAGTEGQRAQRDWRANETVLSGDIGRRGELGDNCYHVVIGADGAVLDGFTVTDGYAFPGPEWRPSGRPPRAGGQTHTTPQAIMGGLQPRFGAGMVNYQCAPTVRNCVFRDNWAGKGGAMYNMVTRSFDPRRPPAREPAAIVEDCLFEDNYARGRGGAVANDLRTSPTFTRCTFIGNRCDGKGGAMYNDFGCSPTVTNCLFVGNRAVRAAAMGNDGASSPVITNCTFTRNHASDWGPSLYQGTGPSNNPVITNCIVWGNTCDYGPVGIANWHECQPIVTGSCVEGGYPGEGNIDADPRFVDPDGGDYGLAEDSPCPQAGHTATAPGQIPSPPAPGPVPTAGKPDLRPDRRLPRQDVVYVSAAAAGEQDGKSWATAYRSLQDGIDHAWRCGGEVWVAAGTYKPGDGRSAALQLRYGVALYGGFRGNETSRDDRDWRANETILSGDIGTPGEAGDNCYHVIIGCDQALLDGFTITGGNANGEGYDGKGGGMVNYYRTRHGPPRGPEIGYSPTVVNCTFRGNSAREGGAVYNFDRCTPRFTNCTFADNTAEQGGAVVDRVGVYATYAKCVFEGNRAQWRGGGLYLDYGSRATVTGSRFLANTTGGHGGAIYMCTRASQLEHTTAALSACEFSGNQADGRGGAIANHDQSLLSLEGCSFRGNSSAAGEADVDTDVTSRAGGGR